jgi:protein-tyrosine phosphatase/membrane-associated phospholipid phosphatase
VGNLHRSGGPARRALMLRAVATSVLLSLLFVIIYGGTNWFTSRRPDADVKTWYFAGELRLIPYVPLLIIPYMSIDGLFFLAPFLCRDEREMRLFARRIVFSILIAAAFFLFLPLKLQWPQRPRVDGWFGEFVERSCTAPFLMEYPHNLFPALHITLCLILSDIYARHTRGIVRALSYAWFALIAVSTILTWQHHLVDVGGGALLAGFAFYLFRAPERRREVVTNVRVGCCYAAAAAALVPLAATVWPGGVFLLWPAAGLGMTAGAYFGIGPGVFRKADGRLPLSTRVVLAPVLIGQYLSLVYYSRRCRARDEVAPGLLVGRVLTEREAASAVRDGVTAVLDLTAEFTEAPSFRKITYRNIPVLDLTAPTCNQLREAVAFLTREIAKGTVYLHCKIGFSRSAAVAGAYLLASRQAATVDEAISRLRRARPSIVIRPEAVHALREFDRSESQKVAAHHIRFKAEPAA